MVDQAKFFLDNIPLAESPEGWDDFATTIKNDRDLNGIYTLMDVTLSFYKDGYDIIYDAINTVGHCGQLSFEMRQYQGAGVYTNVFTGTLFLKSVELSEGNNGRFAKVKIEDNSFFAKIYNNRNLKAKLYAGFSKNGETITPCPYNRLQYFRPSTGSYYVMFTPTGNFVRNNTAFLVYDVLEYLIKFMSDGEMDFYSDTFGSGGQYEDYVITNEFTVRYSQTANGVTQSLFELNWPELSFADVYKELKKAFNLGFVSGFDGSRAYLRIEALEYLRPNVELDTLNNIDNIKTKFAEELLYAKLISGSELVVNAGNLSFPAAIRFIGFMREEYYIQGKCNTDAELDLVNSWVIDTNYIEDLVENGPSLPVDSTDDDRNIILVNAAYDGGVTAYKAVQSNWLDAVVPPYFYNEQLNTDNKTKRYLGAVPNTIALQLGIVDNTFSASYPTQVDATNNGSTVQVQDLDPVQVNNELSDPSGNYNNATYEYTAPTAGSYTFNVQANFRVFDNFPGSGAAGCEVNIEIWLRNTTTGYDQLIYNQHNSPTCGSFININTSGTMNLNASDVVHLRVRFSGSFNAAVHIGSNLRLLAGLLFSCTSSADGGGNYQTYDPEDYPLYLHKFTYPYSLARFKSLSTDPRGKLNFSIHNGRSYTGWLDEIRFKNFKNEANFTLISNKRINS